MFIRTIILYCVMTLTIVNCAAANNISELNQHFNEPEGDISPWIFIPDDNIKEISTKEHPGLVTIWQDGKEKDIKGILEEPLKIEDYPLPWEFQLGLVQNQIYSLISLVADH